MFSLWGMEGAGEGTGGAPMVCTLRADPALRGLPLMDIGGRGRLLRSEGVHTVEGMVMQAVPVCRNGSVEVWLKTCPCVV